MAALLDEPHVAISPAMLLSSNRPSITTFMLEGPPPCGDAGAGAEEAEEIERCEGCDRPTQQLDATRLQVALCDDPARCEYTRGIKFPRNARKARLLRQANAAGGPGVCGWLVERVEIAHWLWWLGGWALGTVSPHHALLRTPKEALAQANEDEEQQGGSIGEDGEEVEEEECLLCSPFPCKCKLAVQSAADLDFCLHCGEDDHSSAGCPLMRTPEQAPPSKLE